MRETCLINLISYLPFRNRYIYQILIIDFFFSLLIYGLFLSPGSLPILEAITWNRTFDGSLLKSQLHLILSQSVSLCHYFYSFMQRLRVNVLTSVTGDYFAVFLRSRAVYTRAKDSYFFSILGLFHRMVLYATMCKNVQQPIRYQLTLAWRKLQKNKKINTNKNTIE